MAWRRRSRATGPLGSVVVIGALLLAGCYATGGGGRSGSLTVAPDDSCGQYRQQLSAYRNYFTTAMAHDADTAAGAGGGYYLAKEKAADGNPQTLAGSVYDDLNTENSEIDGVTATFEKLHQCRLDSARMVKDDLAAHRISRDDAQAKLARYRTWLVQDVDFATALDARMAERGTAYASASDTMMNSAPAAYPTLATRESAPHPQGASGALVATAAARVRAAPTTTSRQIALLAPGEPVTPAGGDTPAGWTHVQLADGSSGYVASRLLSGSGVTAPRPPRDAAGVAALTETNQLKRKALADDIARAKTDANGSAFELNNAIGRARPPRRNA
jgi:Bacterial SH3 domain